MHAPDDATCRRFAFLYEEYDEAFSHPIDEESVSAIERLAKTLREELDKS